ncbi:MAG TPA: hypothetical protein VES67_11120 [Vicinamibacterales bacterium]|nr:hypothetical protein [Vicinamibacterales bacterium]
MGADTQQVEALHDIVEPFLVRYDGRDADFGVLEGDALGESILGSSRLYSTVAHFVVLGYIPKPRGRRELRCYARPASSGSWDQLWSIAPLLAAYVAHPDFHHKAIKFLFQQVTDHIKKIWTKPSDTKKLVIGYRV